MDDARTSRTGPIKDLNKAEAVGQGRVHGGDVEVERVMATAIGRVTLDPRGRARGWRPMTGQREGSGTERWRGVRGGDNCTVQMDFFLLKVSM